MSEKAVNVVLCLFLAVVTAVIVALISAAIYFENEKLKMRKFEIYKNNPELRQ